MTGFLQGLISMLSPYLYKTKRKVVWIWMRTMPWKKTSKNKTSVLFSLYTKTKAQNMVCWSSYQQDVSWLHVCFGQHGLGAAVGPLPNSTETHWQDCLQYRTKSFQGKIKLILNQNILPINKKFWKIAPPPDTLGHNTYTNFENKNFLTIVITGDHIASHVMKLF